MSRNPIKSVLAVAALATVAAALEAARPAEGKGSADPQRPPAAASPEFIATMKQLAAAKPGITKASQSLLAARYNLSGRTDPVARMSGGKPLPVGPTARLASGATWDQLAALSSLTHRSRTRWSRTAAA